VSAIADRGWIDAPSPLQALGELAAELKLEGLWVKREDHLAALGGGNKVRKLDTLLASEPWASAPRWASMGAIGSGSLAALAQAAERLDRRLDAWMFWEPIDALVLENLAAGASGPTTVRFCASRVVLALRRPALVLGGTIDGAAVVPPGASAPAGVLGVVRAGRELARQLQGEETPDRLYVPLGTGGTAVGLTLGLALGGCPIPVHAVAVVERPFTTSWQMTALRRRVARLLGQPDLQGAPLIIRRGFIGQGYGYPTAAGQAAMERLATHGITLEAVYSAKAMAALLADAHELEGQRVVFWLTPHRGALPIADDWRSHLPPDLAARLSNAESHAPAARTLGGVLR